MFSVKERVILVALLGLANANANVIGGQGKVTNYKRAVDPYSYPVPAIGFNEKPGKSKVIVETIKSISPPEFLPSDGYISGGVDGQGNAVGSISYNAFEADSARKTTTTTTTNLTTGSATPKKKPTKSFGGYRYGGSSTETDSSTASPAPVRTSSVEPPTTLLPGFQYTSRVMGPSSADSDVQIAGSKVKGTGYATKGGKKPTRLDQKHSDSKPEETGFNGYHYDVGSTGFATPTKLGGGGGGGGMMGASYMRSSSPFYNFHVMLD